MFSHRLSVCLSVYLIAAILDVQFWHQHVCINCVFLCLIHFSKRHISQQTVAQSHFFIIDWLVTFVTCVIDLL